MVAVPDPEEQDGHDAHRRDRSEDTDAAFAAIVAEWRTEPDAPRWPTDGDQVEQRHIEQDPDPHPSRISAEHPAPDGDDDHFQPPDPPPFPIPQPRTIGGVLLVAFGALLLIQPGLVGLGGIHGTPLGLLAVSAGIGWLVLGLRGGPPPDGWDDGARL